MQLIGILTAAFASALVAAHPGQDHHAEAAIRRELLQDTKSDLNHCAEKLRARGLTQRQESRRRELARSLRLARGLPVMPRDLGDLNKSHHAEQHYSAQTDPSTIFTSNNSCILSPEAIEGPYYVVGESVRPDITEKEAGVPLVVDTQVLNMETCEPIKNVYVEIWHCNSTGVYGGVSAEGNGDATDKANLNKTSLRGLQLSDADGITTFRTIFPGHYQGRATHIHIMVHLNATKLSNGTVLDTKGSHVGQMFFDQNLINEVEKLTPYTANTQPLWLNNQDGILLQAAATSDPLMEYVYLGDAVGDGVLAWLAFGVNVTNVRDITPGAFYYKEGGLTNPNGGFPPGIPPGGLPGGPPGGPPPTSTKTA